MKTLITFLLLLSSMAFGQTDPNQRLVCSFQNGYFKVFDGAQRFEFYVGSFANKIECGRDFGIAITATKFLTYFQGQFQEKYVGGNGSHISQLRGRLAVAVMGPHLIVAKAGGPIIEKYLPGSTPPTLELSSSIGVISKKPFLIFTDGATITEEYIHNMNYQILVAGREVAGALVGNSMITYHDGVVSEKYIVSRRSTDTIVSGRSKILAASLGNYFMIFDGTRGQFAEEYVGGPGRVEVREEGAYLFFSNGKITRYHLGSGTFESFSNN